MTVVNHSGLPVGIRVSIQVLSTTGAPVFHSGLSASITTPLELVASAAGSWSADLVPNNALTPASFYYVQEFFPFVDANGSRGVTSTTYRVTVPSSGGPYDVTSIGTAI